MVGCPTPVNSLPALKPCLGNCKPLPVALGVIKHFEGYSLMIYQGAAGYGTIGFGHLIKPGEEILEPLLGEAAGRLPRQDVAPKAAAVIGRVSVPLFRGQFDAMVSWTLNLGEGALQRSTMLKRINAARHEEVPEQIKRWNRAGGKGLKGPARRREAEAARYRRRWDSSVDG
jgi:lysozyme